MKCMNEKELGAYQVKRNLKKLEESLRNKFGVRWECFWERNREVSKYRRKWFSDHAYALYREASKSRQMQVSRGIEGSNEEVSRKYSSTAEVSIRYRGSTHQNQEQKLNRSTRCREAIEHTDPISIDPPGVAV